MPDFLSKLNAQVGMDTGPFDAGAKHLQQAQQQLAAQMGCLVQTGAAVFKAPMQAPGGFACALSAPLGASAT